ncbi:MAG: 30S ribosomal protein S4 [bacterium]|nr:30S ribosomal protein S4 [bacterium]
MIIHAKEKKERALGEKLFLKAHRCSSPKCSMIRRPYRPGVHGKNRRKISDFGTQLMAKQKLKITYGVSEHKLKNIFKEASRNPAATGEKMIELLERRLDNTVFRAGFADSRPMAHNLVSQGHISVNGKRTRIPSFMIRKGDKIGIRLESQERSFAKDLKEKAKSISLPIWLSLESEKLTAEVKAIPKETDMIFDVSRVIEFFSKNN